MNERLLSFLPRSPYLSGLVVFFGALFLTQYLAYQRYQIINEGRREQALREAAQVKDRLKATLSNSLSATRTLAYIIEQQGVPGDFSSVAKNILDANPNIDAIQLTRNGVITHVYPMNGNEAVIGYDIFTNPSIEGEARKAIERNTLFFAGPLKLKQGGVGVVGRLPIYKSADFTACSRNS
jgi:sensor domain CHASE-containing protein